MAPGLPNLAAVQTVCAALSRPFNFMAGIKGRSFTTEELASAGVKRVSLATSLYRAAMSGLVNAAREVSAGLELLRCAFRMQLGEKGLQLRIVQDAHDCTVSR